LMRQTKKCPSARFQGLLNQRRKNEEKEPQWHQNSSAPIG
jgi:hypothetical protein